jgi:uncharacterized protein with PQ loop repeat
VLPVGFFTNDAAGAFGFVAAAIAVFGFLGQAPSAIAKKEDAAVRAATVIGGLFGFGLGLIIIIVGYIW